MANAGGNDRTITLIPLRDRFGCTLKEASEATGLKPTKLYELIAAGATESKKIDRRRIILVRSLQKLLEGEDTVDRLDTPTSV